MSYEKTDWKNRLVERPKTFRFQQNADGTVTLIPEEGQVLEPGTPLNAGNLNKMEQGIADAVAHLADEIKHITAAERTSWNGKQESLPVENRRKITFGTANPSGGSDGDIYFQYE